MARHITFTLDSETARHAARIREALKSAAQESLPVSFTVQGRDSGTVTERVGMVQGFSGQPGMSSESVTVETPAGYRTFNVWLIRTIQMGG